MVKVYKGRDTGRGQLLKGNHGRLTGKMDEKIAIRIIIFRNVTNRYLLKASSTNTHLV